MPPGRACRTSACWERTRPCSSTSWTRTARTSTPIAPMSIGSALHPTSLQDGRVMFSSSRLRASAAHAVGSLGDLSGRSQLGAADERFVAGRALHFMTQMGNGDIVVETTTTGNNNGFGVFYRFPVDTPFETPAFYPAFLTRTRTSGKRAAKANRLPLGFPSVLGASSPSPRSPTKMTAGSDRRRGSPGGQGPRIRRRLLVATCF